jgi:hypothetical protein
MQIILSEAEITSAVETFVRNQINVADGHVVNIDFKNGRGETGISATLDISPEEKGADKKAKMPKKTAPTAKEEKPESAPEKVKPELVEDPVETSPQEEESTGSIFDKAS